MEVPKTESRADVVARLLKNGGYVLVVGGGTEKLPERYLKHPQVLTWDDNHQGLEHKQVPSNVRAILYNRWLSHAVARRVRYAAEQLRIPIFPMLKTREVREILDGVVHEEPIVTIPETPIELPPEEPSTTPAFLMPEDLAVPKQQLKPGALQTFIAKHVRGDLTIRGSIAAEGRRLMPLLKEAGIKTTEGSVVQAIKVFKDKGLKPHKGAPEPTRERKESSVTKSDEFAEIERLLTDARSALDLALEAIPTFRKKIEQIEKKQAKLRELLGDE
jgi:hypothetical protein